MNNNYFDTLRRGAPARLADYRQRLKESLATIRKHRTPEEAEQFIQNMGYDSWKRERWIVPHGLGFNAPSPRHTRSDAYGGVIFMDSGELDHLRPIAPDDKTRDYGRGWYADQDGGETVTGKVVQLPTGRGRQSRWLAYAVHSDNDGIWLDKDVYDDPTVACHNADRLAERIAEEDREYNGRWQAARDLEVQIDELKEELHDARGEASEALHAYGEQRELGEVAKSTERLLFDQLATARARMHRCIEKITDLRAERADIDVET